MSNDAAIQLFRQIDVNGDGQLESYELRAWLEAKGEETLANSLFDNLDTNSDGVVSLQEFVAGFEQTKLRKIAEDESKLLSSPETSPVLRAVSLQWLLEFVEQNKRKAFSWRNEREFMAPEDGGGEEAILEVKRGNSLVSHRKKRRAAEKAKSGKQVVVRYTDILFEDMYTSDVVACFVSPVAKGKNLSYAMAENLKIGAPTYFVSHAWGNRFNDLVRSVAAHLDGAVAKETFIWLDIFAINQNNAMAELNIGGTGKTLRQTIEHARATVAVLDKERVVPLSRLWCLYELGSTPQEKLQLVTQGFDEKEIAARIEDIDASTALCFSEDDRKFIHGEIEKRFGGLDKFTRHLKLRFLLNPLDYEADMKVLRQRAKTETFRFDAIRKFFEDGGNVACIVGGAGEGKSTISATALNGVSLDAAAVHICKDADVRRQDELRVIHSLAYQLAVRFEEVAHSILGLKNRMVDDGKDHKGKPINQRPALTAIQTSAKWAKNLLLIEPLESLLSSGRQDQSPPCLLMFDALDEGFTRNNKEEEDDERYSSSKESNRQNNPALSLACSLLERFGKKKLQILVTTRPKPGHVIRIVEAVAKTSNLNAKTSNLNLKRFEPSELRDNTAPTADIIIRPELQKAIANSNSKAFELVATRFAETYPDLAKSRPVPTNADEAYRQWFEAASPLAPETKRLMNVIFAAREPLTMSHLEQMGLHAAVSNLPGLGLLFEEREHKLHMLHKSLSDFLRDANRSGEELAVDVFSGDVEITRSCVLIERQERGGQLGSYAKEYCQDHFKDIISRLEQMKKSKPSLVLRPMVVSILDELGFHHKDENIKKYVRKELLNMEEALEQDVFISFVIKETASWAHLIKYKLADVEFSKRAKTVGGGIITSFVCGTDGASEYGFSWTWLDPSKLDTICAESIRVEDIGRTIPVRRPIDDNSTLGWEPIEVKMQNIQMRTMYDLGLKRENDTHFGLTKYSVASNARFQPTGDFELTWDPLPRDEAEIMWEKKGSFEKTPCNYPVDALGLTYWTDAVEKAILKCKVFVAILSPLYGVPRPNFQRDIANVQPQVIGRDDGNCWTSLELLCARALGKPIVFLCVDPPSKTSELWKKNVLGKRDTWIQLPKYNDGMGAPSNDLDNVLLRACEEICSALPYDDGSKEESYSRYTESIRGLGGGEYAQSVIEQIKVGAANIETVNSEKLTPLMQACGNGDVFLVRKLIDLGANINEMGGYYSFEYGNGADGQTSALMCATHGGHAECVSFLLEAGADVHMEYGSSTTVLMCAASQGHAECVSMLLEAGADVHLMGGFSGTAALHEAAHGQGQGNVEAVRLLLHAGANVNMKAGYPGRTALIYASCYGKVEIVSALLHAGADVHVKDNNGRTALMDAAQNGHAEIVSALLQAGADVNVKGSGETALMDAALRGHAEIVGALLQARADVNVKGSNGWTALMNAARQGHAEIVNALLQAGADVNMKDDYGKTALMDTDSEKCKELLRAAGATS